MKVILTMRSMILLFFVCVVCSSEYGEDSKNYAGCFATDRKHKGQPCVFPFKTGEGLKYNCTIVGDLDFEFWCATQTDDDHNMYEWGHCSPGCHKPQDMQDTGINDVLEENAEMKKQIRWLEDVIIKNISDLVERMEHQEDMLMTWGNITDLVERMEHHTDMISENTLNIARHDQEIKTNTDNIANNTRHINTHNTCAFQDRVDNTGTITYDRLISDSTSDNSAIDINTGHFTTDTTGYYTITYSASTYDYTGIWAYINNKRQGDHTRYYSTGGDWHQVSRTWTQCLKKGDSLHLQAEHGIIADLTFCVNLVTAVNC